MLENVDFISMFNEHYGMNAHEFFKFIYRLCPSMFNGLYIKKI